MFDGLKNNRCEWNKHAEIYNAKMKVIEDEKKKLEDDENKKGMEKNKTVYTGHDPSLHNHPV